MSSDVNITNSTISNFTGSGTTYNFTVTPNADGPVTVDVPAGTATDIANNNNTAATQLTRTYDATAPTVGLTSASPTTTNVPFLVTATFSESVTGFIASDVNVTNSTLSNFTGSGKTIILQLHLMLKALSQLMSLLLQPRILLAITIPPPRN